VTLAHHSSLQTDMINNAKNRNDYCILHINRQLSTQIFNQIFSTPKLLTCDIINWH